MEQKNFLISHEALNKLFSYLGTRPYVEVFELVKELQTVKPQETSPLLVEEASNEA